MAAMDKPAWSIAETRARVRLSLRESFPLHFGERWEEARGIYLDRFRAIHLERLAALPGLRRTAARRSAKRVSFSASSATRPARCCGARPRQLGWSRHFGRLVGAGDAAADKPDPAPVGLALEPSGVGGGGGGMVCRRHRRRYGLRAKRRLRAGAAGRRSRLRRIAAMRAAPPVFRACGAAPLCPGLVIYSGAPIFVSAARRLNPARCRLGASRVGSAPKIEWGNPCLRRSHKTFRTYF